MRNDDRTKNNISLEKFFRGLCIYMAAAFLLVFLVIPMGTLFVQAFLDKTGAFVGFSQFVDYFESGALVQSVKNTVYIAAISTVISVTLAFFFAYSLSRKCISGKRVLKYIAMMPIYAPTMLLGIGLVYLFGNKGILTALGVSCSLYGKTGIIMAESLYCFPTALTILSVAFSNADNHLYEAADTMDTSPLRKMLTITLPNVKYGLISALFVAFTYSFTDFGAPSVVGGNYNVLATDVYKQVIGQQNFNMGAVVGIILLIPAVLSFIVDRIVNQKQNASVNAKAVPYVIKPHKRSDFVAGVFCYAVAAGIVGFFLISLFASLIKLWPYNLTFTLQNYDFSDVAAGKGVDAIRNSVLVAVVTAFVGTCITFLTAYMIEKSKGLRGIRSVTYFMSIAPLAIPGTVIGLSYILFFNKTQFAIPFTQYALVSPFHGLYGSMWILVFANIIHYYSVPFTTATTALKKLDREFEAVGEAMGVPFLKTFFRVTVPLCFPAISEMLVYYFVNAMVTISAVVFLYSPSFTIASVTIVNLEGAGDIERAVAMCMTILAINIVLRLVYETTLDIYVKRKKNNG